MLANPSDLPDLLTRAIIRSGLSQKQVAAKTGVSERQLRRWRKGNCNTLEIIKVLEALGWKVELHLKPPPLKEPHKRSTARMGIFRER